MEEPAEGPSAPNETPESTPAPDPAPATEPAATAIEPMSTSVVLGDPTLTAGIPGEGDLTIEQIQAWLKTPGVHEPLEFELPFGLSLAAGNIKGVEANPLTRAKIELGRQLYMDKRLSADSTVSCATCHDPAHGYAAPTQFGVGINGQEGGRNSPVAYNRILSDKQFWDGRAESLETQAIGPIANPIEMGNTHDACVKTIGEIPGYKAQFDAVFGEGPVTIENVGKAIASFERVIVTGPAPYDYYAALEPFLTQFTPEDLADLKEDDPDVYARYEKLKADADANPMSESAIRGKQLFFSDKSNCTACHAGANFTDELYHNLGVGMAVEEPDLGRFAETKEDKDRGAFKTPTIRNVALTAPYMHDGSQKTLEEVVEWYVKGGHPNDHLSDKVKKLELSDQDKADLVEFMKACTGAFPKVELARLP
ncbi:MAG: c-type cytochrome [Planctomycetaceae bacterium]|nr:c-type cytochrome [Planctomycetaceae bacterium]